MVYDSRRFDNDRRDRSHRYQDRERDQDKDNDRDARDYSRHRPNGRDPAGKDVSRPSRGLNTGRERPNAFEHTAGPSTLTSPQNDFSTDRQTSRTAPPTPSAARATIASMSALTITTTEPIEAWQQLFQLTSDRAYHSIMKHRAEKTYQKAQQVWEKCRQGPHDFGSALAFSEKQKKDAEEERNIFDRLLKADDEKWSVLFPQALPTTGQPVVQNGSRKPFASNGNSPIMKEAELEAKITSMEESLQKRIYERISKKIEEEFASMRRKHKSELESQALRLQMDMASTTERYQQEMSQVKTKAEFQALKIDALEERVKQLEEEKSLQSNQAGSQTTVHECAFSKSNAAAIRDLSESINNQHSQIGNVDARLGQFELALSQSASQLHKLAGKLNEPRLPAPEKAEAEEKQRQGLAMLQAEWSKLPVESLQNLPTDFSHNKMQVQGSLDKMSAELAKLQTQISVVRERQSQSPTPSAALDPRMDQRIEQVVKSHLKDSEIGMKRKQELVDGFSVLLDRFSDKERNHRVALQSDVEAKLQAVAVRESQMQGQMEAKLRDLQSAINEVKSNPQGNDNFTEEQNKHNYRFSDNITLHSQRIISIDNRQDILERFVRANCESVDMRIHDLKHWQNNFDTRILYRDIMAHINATVPENTSKTLTNLDQRMGVLESRFSACEDGNKKRRRLADGFCVTGGDLGSGSG